MLADSKMQGAQNMGGYIKKVQIYRKIIWTLQVNEIYVSNL